MKKQFIIISALLFSMLGFSQGIKFENGNRKEVLEKAKLTNKPIFVDVTAPYCAPCRAMATNIFPLEEVGKVYNTNFISYKIDLSNEENRDIAKQYDVRTIPTFLFIRPDGSIFYKTIGYRNTKDFIEESEKALAVINDPKPINVWEKEYADNKNDPTIVLGYINKRSSLGMTSSKLFDEYLQLIPEKERTSPTVIELYKKEAELMQISTFAYSYLQKSQTAFKNAWGADKAYVNYILCMGLKNSTQKAKYTKDEKLLADVVAAYDLLPEDTSMPKDACCPQYFCKDEIYMEYYAETKDMDKYFQHAVNMGNNCLMKNADQGRERNKISWHLNNLAWEIFNNVSGKQMLQDALLWSKRSLEISPKNTSWMDTYANLLYKLGNKQEAIAKEEAILRLINKTKNPRGYKEKTETIRKMKAGEKTWKN